MKALVHFIMIAQLLLLAGCANMHESQPSVPAPDSTPFDSNPLQRAAYLDAYRDGYRSAASGETISTDFVRGPHRFAREMGWRAGAAQALSNVEQSSKAD